MITKFFTCEDCGKSVNESGVDPTLVELKLCNDCYENAQLEEQQQDEILREQQSNYDRDVGQSLRRY